MQSGRWKWKTRWETRWEMRWKMQGGRWKMEKVGWCGGRRRAREMAGPSGRKKLQSTVVRCVAAWSSFLHLDPATTLGMRRALEIARVPWTSPPAPQPAPEPVPVPTVDHSSSHKAPTRDATTRPPLAPSPLAPPILRCLYLPTCSPWQSVAHGPLIHCLTVFVH